MSFLNRNRPEAEVTAELVTRISGRWDACTTNQCPVRGTVKCSYVDRMGEACNTVWCEVHCRTVREQKYCRRHASIASALAGDVFLHMLPKVDNRAPSLVNWVGAELDASIQNALQAALPNRGEVVSSAVKPGLGSNGQIYAWLRSWKLTDKMGVLLSVSLEVEEKDDAAVVVKVGKEVIGRRLPPWIGRDTKEVLSSSEDEFARQAFRGKLMDDVELGLRKALEAFGVAPPAPASFS